MKQKFISLSLFLFLIFSFNSFAQERPQITFEDLMISAEENVALITDARKLAEKYDIPHTIYLPEGVFIEAKSIENNRVVYTIFNDLLHPFNNGEVAFWEEINARYDLTNARVHWSNKPTQNPELGYNFSGEENRAISFVMVVESTNNMIMTFNYNDGSLINATYIPLASLSTPIEGLLTYTATIIVSGQVSDNIVEFDTLGNFIRVLFGGNTAIYDNARGIELRPGFNTVVGTVAASANQHAIAEFDLTTGNYLGNFIAPNASQMAGPWDIIFRAADCLVTASTTNNVTRYDLAGNYLGVFVPSLNFPEQLYETTSGNIIVATFSTPSGLYIYDPTGNQLNYFGAVTGLRGAIQLGNGNYMITNGSGVHILDQNTGTLLISPVTGVSGRFIREYDLSIVPVELTSFAANVVNGNVVLNWTTASELNNYGFEIERSDNKVSFNKIGFVPGFGTTTENKSYSYTDQSVNSGTYYYRLKQIDLDGSFTYSEVKEVGISVPVEFTLEQNYPNPFNPTTNIKFSLPVESNVTIRIFNLIGQEVKEVVSGNFSAGTYDVIVDGSDLSSGLYFYQLNAVGEDGKDFKSTKKMLLMK